MALSARVDGEPRRFACLASVDAAVPERRVSGQVAQADQLDKGAEAVALGDTKQRYGTRVLRSVDRNGTSGRTRSPARVRAISLRMPARATSAERLLPRGSQGMARPADANSPKPTGSHACLVRESALLAFSAAVSRCLHGQAPKDVRRRWFPRGARWSASWSEVPGPRIQTGSGNRNPRSLPARRRARKRTASPLRPGPYPRATFAGSIRPAQPGMAEAGSGTALLRNTVFGLPAPLPAILRFSR